MCDETKFSVMCSLFNWTQKTKSTAKKRSKLRKFLDTFCNRTGGYFSAVRLILPALDRNRSSYGLKESVLATCLVDALGMSRQSEDARRLFNWRKGGPEAGPNAGNFALVAAEVLQNRQGSTSGGLTIKELNELLDRLALSENSLSSSEVNVLRERSLHVVGSQWLEDCFDKEQRLQEERYSLKPTSLEGSSSGEWKHNPCQGDLSCMDTVEQQNMSSHLTEDGKQRKAKASSRLLSSPQKDMERKRGRPTSKSRDKRKISVIQHQRSWGRPRKSATIHENESDVNAYSEKNAIAIAEESKMKIGDNRGQVQEVGEDAIRGVWVGKGRGAESASGDKARDSEKREVMVGPAQSMLINVIPSIGMKKVDCMDTATEEGKPSEDNNGETVKKKKRVSYKDVAGELLRDG